MAGWVPDVFGSITLHITSTIPGLSALKKHIARRLYVARGPFFDLHLRNSASLNKKKIGSGCESSRSNVALVVQDARYAGNKVYLHDYSVTIVQ